MPLCLCGKDSSVLISAISDIPFIRVQFLIGFLVCIVSTCPVSAATVRATLIDGRTTEGTFDGVEHDGRIQLTTDGKSTPLAASDLMSLRFASPQSQPAAAGRPAEEVTAYLNDGSHFNARITGTTSEKIDLTTALIQRITLPITGLAAIRFARDDSSPAAKAFADALNHRDTTQDALLLVQGEKVSALRGLLESLDPAGGKFKWRERSIPIDRNRAFGLILAAGAGTPPTPQVRCTLADGSIWAGKITGGTSQSLKLELTAGPSIDIGLDQIADLRFRNDRMVFLSDLEPAGYDFKPWGATVWPYRKDRGVAGQPIRIGNQEFDRGIGMHSQSTLAYKLNEPFIKLAAVVGLDDAVGSRGNVVFRVLVDGKEVFNSGEITGRDAPRPVTVDIKGARLLQLCVDFGGDLDVADQADWGAVRLIR
jgi:hypothetical protein